MNSYRITIRPSAEMVDILVDKYDTEINYWLGRVVPASAAERLARLQEIATIRIWKVLPGAMVGWSSEYVHTSGAVDQVIVSVDDAGITQKRVHEHVQTILDLALQDVAEVAVE